MRATDLRISICESACTPPKDSSLSPKRLNQPCRLNKLIVGNYEKFYDRRRFYGC
ncbi:hypothetical protein PL8927_130005 [Planktothrix serta PCC 8927]|uniref:Uncharacterized protein n=1 Tax=Planktothrix serta PCC 8927 TaxID=671068 RepID=A0A7Z9BER6_9CYAN|nr:hypothetical protein PL8927_130005 [Planktothrix serta PCC 8927]